MEKRYRTRQEMIEYFKLLAHEFEKDAQEHEKKGNVRIAAHSWGKFDAYKIAAFELEHNMEG